MEMIIAEDLSTRATGPASSILRAIIPKTTLTKQTTPTNKNNENNENYSNSVTKEKYFQFLFIVCVIDVNVSKGENKEGDDNKDDLSAGSETGHMDLAKFSEDDAADAVEDCGHNQDDAGNQEQVIVSITSLLRITTQFSNFLQILHC